MSSRPRARLVLLTIASVGLFLQPFSAQTRTPPATTSTINDALPALVEQGLLPARTTK